MIPVRFKYYKILNEAANADQMGRWIVNCGRPLHVKIKRSKKSRQRVTEV